MTKNRRPVSGDSEAIETQERDALRAWRSALNEETEQLRCDFDSARDDGVIAVFLTMNLRLKKHNEALTRYHVRLEAFHRLYGPLGP